MIALFSASGPVTESNRAAEVFRYEDTSPVSGMPEIRAALPAGTARYKPALYQADKRGWVVVADSFAAYRAARDTNIANHLPTLLETSGAETPVEKPAIRGLNEPPTALDSSQAMVPRAATVSVSVKRTSTPRSRAPEVLHLSDDPVIYFKHGDDARAHAAACELHREGLPITQANMNHALGYASTPPAPQSADSPDPGRPAPMAGSSRFGLVNGKASTVVADAICSFSTPVQMLVQPSGRGRLPPTGASTKLRN